MPTPDLAIEWEAPKKWVTMDENEWDMVGKQNFSENTYCKSWHDYKKTFFFLLGGAKSSFSQTSKSESESERAFIATESISMPL